MRFSSRFYRVLITSLVWILLASYAWHQLRPVHAASEFSYTIDMNYAINDDGTTRVTSSYRITNNTNNRVLASLQINTPTNDVADIAARYADGSSLPFSAADKTNTTLGNFAYKEINLRFADWPSGRGTTQDFSVSYTTGSLVDIKGSSRTFYVPSLAEVGANENYNISVSVPASFGTMISTGALPQIDGSDGDKVRYRFANANDLLGRSFTLIFGETTIYKADFTFPLKNTTNRDRVFTVTLPPNTPTQKIYINKLDPQPIATRVDTDGNILADYTVPARGTVTVHTDISAQVTYRAYDLSKGGKTSDIPQELIRDYTGSTRFWQTDDAELRAKAQQAVSGKTNVVDILRALQKLTNDTLTYNNEKIKYNIRQGSGRALRNPDNAVCLEYSDLMIALLRSQGIPARMPVGYAYAGTLKQSKSVADSLHSWVEAYVPGIGWMNLDPTWSEKFDNFGKSDLDHFTFAIWGRQDAVPAAVMLDNTDINYQYEQTSITYDSSLSVTQQKGAVTAKTYVVLPGVSFVQYSATAPGVEVGDNYAVLLKQADGKTQRVVIGRMAPLQKQETGLFAFGAAFATPTQVVFVQNTETGDIVYGAATSTIIWWPAILAWSVIAGIILLILVKLSIRRRRRFRESGKAQLTHGGTARAREIMERALAAQHEPDKLSAEQQYIEKK